MKIGVDVMGGDYAPHEIVKGAIQATSHLSRDSELLLLGNEDAINRILASENKPPSIGVMHTDEVIEMGEHPTKALSKKKNSSISVGFHLLQNKRIDAFVGAGNTGAMLVGAMYSVQNIPGVIRPTISTIIPKKDGSQGLLLDIGANADCKPDNLYQFAILGSLYAKHVLGIKKPRVGLLNIGEEETKGNILTQATYPLMTDSDKFDFIGNIEGRDLLSDTSDVIVCDGFTGNIVLKTIEGMYELFAKSDSNNLFMEKFNYENYGGTPILGINAPVIIGHGISKAPTIKNMLLLAEKIVNSDLVSIIKSSFN